MKFKTFRYIAAYLFTFSSIPLIAQQKGQIIKEIIHSQALEHTVTQESPDRQVSVYLPPSYTSSRQKRYPVIYLLHGWAGTDTDWFNYPTAEAHYATIQQIMDKGISTGAFGEMIIVMPDEKTHWFGSFYTNSSATGNWEDFTRIELVRYIDQSYRTLAHAESRGIAGHSMGGYGALTIGMKYPDTFNAVYGLSPAIIDFSGELSAETDAFEKAWEAQSFAELGKGQDIYTMAVVTVAQAFSPNPNAPPFYADLPFQKVHGKMVPNPTAYSRWTNKFPIGMVQRYKDNLTSLQGIKFDVGDRDEFSFIVINSKAFSQELKKYGIPHSFEVYNGDHRNQIMGKKGRMYTQLLPFFWETLRHQ